MSRRMNTKLLQRAAASCRSRRISSTFTRCLSVNYLHRRLATVCRRTTWKRRQLQVSRRPRRRRNYITHTQTHIIYELLNCSYVFNLLLAVSTKQSRLMWLANCAPCLPRPELQAEEGSAKMGLCVGATAVTCWRTRRSIALDGLRRKRIKVDGVLNNGMMRSKIIAWYV